ncbi:hypothetical protein D3C80_1336460 [compost metagenome]
MRQLSSDLALVVGKTLIDPLLRFLQLFLYLADPPDGFIDAAVNFRKLALYFKITVTR